MSVEQLIGDLGCSGCHSGISIESNVIQKTPDLSFAGQQYSPAYLFHFLQNPVKVRQFIGYSRMPDFHLSRKEAIALVLFLIKSVPGLESRIEKHSELQQQYMEVRADYPNVNSEEGKAIFIALNCRACHQNRFVPSPEKKIAPDLNLEKKRVKKEWLVQFLKSPTAVRPFGYYPGSGSRMPDFRLTDNEVKLISDYLMEGEIQTDSSEYHLKKLSPFSMKKVTVLLQTKLACLGCHRLGKEGGRIGPNLSNLKTRLQPSYVYQIVKNPKEIISETIMPKIVLAPRTLNLIVNFLLQQEMSSDSMAYLSLTDHPLYLFNVNGEKGYELYQQYCSPCHGNEGNGNGFNAKYLPIKPTVHSDKNYISKRPDDTLFDGIFSGGYILNKSPYMPPFGYTLQRTEIKELVTYIRELCQCEGPNWSRDNRNEKN